MDTILQSQLQRVETAFNSLIESITSYNPSPAAAGELVSADDSLCQGLEQLSTHQSNYAHILRLRHTVRLLETQIKTTVSQLAEARVELIANAPADSTPANGSCGGREQTREVPLDELLAYAKRISKFTVAPPASRAGRKKAEKVQGGGGASDGAGAEGGASLDTGNKKDTAGKEGADGIAVASLSELERKWQDQMAELPFVPWPTEEMIKSGGLSEIQSMVEEGKDPVQEVGRAEEERIKMEAEGEEVQRRREREEAEDRRRRESVQVGGASRGSGRESQAAAVFGGLDLYDPDEV